MNAWRITACAWLLLATAVAGGCATPSPAVLTPAAVRNQPEDYIVVAVRNDAPAYARAGGTARRYEDNRYLESARARQSLHAIADTYRLQPISGWPIAALSMQCVIFKKPRDVAPQALLDKLQRDARIALAQPLQSFTTNTGASTGYNDPYAALQTNLTQMGVREAHQWSRGKNVRIAVIDTGVDSTHPELRDRIAVQRNFVDSDGKQFVADRHGTAVAGVIAANANNGIGIVGIAPQAQLFALKACWQLRPEHDEAMCNSFTLAQALMSAIDLHAHIINLSVVGPADPLLSALIERAQHDGIIVVGAAGTDNNRFAAQLSHVIGVSGMENENLTISAANVLHAPSRDVMTLRPGGGYDFSSGNSIAAAEVTGAIALLLADSPGTASARIDAEQARQILLQTGMAHETITSINACLAVAHVRGLAACNEGEMHVSSSPVH